MTSQQISARMDDTQKLDPIRLQAVVMAAAACDRLQRAGHLADFDAIADRYERRMRLAGIQAVIGPHGRPVAALPCPLEEGTPARPLVELAFVALAVAVVVAVGWGLTALVQ